jgi:pimeloyl-ACP methyl ester carboxylesterase
VECKLENITIHYQSFGEGKPILILHGAPLDHRALLGCMEPLFKNRAGWLRIYPDLPGMGRTKGANWITSAEQMLEVILKFIDQVIPGQSFTLVGHSYAGYLARGITYYRRQAVNGLFLLVPWIRYDWEDRSTPEKVTLIEDPALLAQLTPEEREEFAFGAVVQNQKNWERFRSEWLPGIRAHEPQFFAQLLDHAPFSFDVDMLSEPFVKPTLVLVGKQDHVSGYRNQWDILENYPRATFAVLDRAGHRLQIEQETLFNVLVDEWLDRVEECMVNDPAVG